jgi:hypothetical protein
MRFRYTPAVGNTVEEIQENVRQSELFKSGDIALVWVNAEDLALLTTLNGMMDDAISSDTSDTSADRLQPGETPISEVDWSDLYES